MYRYRARPRAQLPSRFRRVSRKRIEALLRAYDPPRDQARGGFNALFINLVNRAVISGRASRPASSFPLKRAFAPNLHENRHSLDDARRAACFFFFSFFGFALFFLFVSPPRCFRPPSVKRASPDNWPETGFFAFHGKSERAGVRHADRRKAGLRATV